ncbi:MAG: pyridoxal phosphate-dependent aminotransferase [Ndongobacter sp.]|nr:pyridoxal phosphate-dependent aminotransferase [Ndongobacter sp.]
MYIAERVRKLGVAPTRRYNKIVQDMEAKGIKVLKLSVGQPDIQVPERFFEAITAHTNHLLQYAYSPGIPEMRSAQRRYYQSRGLEFQEDEIFITSGATEALTFALLTTCDIGDSIVLIEPFYTNYALLTDVYGLQINAVSTSVETGYRIPEDDVLDAAVTENTRAILISNPGNPTGRVYTEEELERLIRFALRHDITLIADEVYREFNFSGRPFRSLASYPEIQNHLLLLDSVSKKYAACGARVGSISTKNPVYAEQLMKLCQMRLATPTLEQIGAAALSDLDEGYFAQIDALYRSRREALAQALSRIPNIRFSTPEGAFYSLVALPVEDAEDFVVWTLTNFSKQGETILTTPAEGFYFTPGLGRNEIRISYAVHVDILRRAISLLGEALQAYLRR